ncbi:MAG: DinB family protein [Pirellulaceae bacterium]
MPDDTQLELARKQIEFARSYTKTLLAEIELDEWFAIPDGCVSHIAWQVGHLAMAQYGLCLFRIRGRQPIDTELMSGAFRKKYSKGTTPDPDPANNPSPDEIMQVFERVDAQTMTEMLGYDAATLGESVDMPYTAYGTKLGALLFCSHHEMLHAGQIGLLRRLLGKSPVR